MKMSYVRAGNKRRRVTTTRRRPRTTARPARMRMTRGVPQVTHFRTKLKHYMETWTYSSASTAGFWKYYTFTPSMLGSQFSDFSSVFDEYKISGVSLELRPNFDSIDYTSAAVVSLGSLHYSVDPSSAVVPAGTMSTTTLNLFFEQSQNVKSRKTDQVTKIYYKPKISSQVYGGGISGRTQFCPWLKCAYSPSEVFSGVHLFIQPNSITSIPGVKYDIYVTCYMQFRGNA